jgi:hypothetical protein
MQLTLANHPVAEIHFGTPTRLDGTTLVIDSEDLCRLLLEDEAMANVRNRSARRELPGWAALRHCPTSSERVWIQSRFPWYFGSADNCRHGDHPCA